MIAITSCIAVKKKHFDYFQTTPLLHSATLVQITWCLMLLNVLPGLWSPGMSQ